ncbi:hypothetical protein VVD49_13415 [Uliginosibacterium sp. H3]|uniref:Uncharacterized protein n=1 Tax=Uliginosibacterium silvisoli TaxID=3114758 RepID=A0ABU6K502_9RHOO|nr:hypothetical protein [Uliginosibacterium sp. H3]
MSFTCDFDWKLALEYVKVFLNWPAIFLYIVLLAVWPKREQVLSWISDIRGSFTKLSVQALGAEVSIERQATDVARLPETSVLAPNIVGESLDTASGSQGSDKSAIDPPSDARKKKAQELVEKTPNGQAVVEYIKQFPEVVLMEFEDAFASWQFERIYGQIFGTQLRLLDALMLTDFATAVGLQVFFEEHKRLLAVGITNPAPADFNRYMSYLLINNLVVEKIVSSEIGYHVTDTGRRFIDYVKRVYAMNWAQKPL